MAGLEFSLLNSLPLSLRKRCSFQPAAFGSLATRRAKTLVWRLVGLRSLATISSAQANEERISIAVSC